MNKPISLNIIIILVLISYTHAAFPDILLGKTTQVKTSYKRYSFFKYKNEDVLCEPYTVNKDDWLYKIFRKKGEISEKDFPTFLIIFKEINPQISNIDAIEPGINILIPLKKVIKGDYNQTSSGTVDVPVIEFSSTAEDLKSFIQKHKIKKGETISNLIDKDFLQKGGALSEEGMKAFQLANPNIKNINIVYEGSDIYLPDPSMRAQPWFRSLFPDKPASLNEREKKEHLVKQQKIDAFKLAQLKKYSSLIGGVLLSQGKMYFPLDENSNQMIDLSVTPVIETKDGSKILILTGDTLNDELIKSVQSHWKNLKTQMVADALDQFKKDKLKQSNRPKPKKNIISEFKKQIEALLSQTEYKYIPNARIPFMLNKISLEATFGRIIRQDSTDLLINYGNVYGAALNVLKKREFEVISISPQLTPLELANLIFSHLDYTTWENPSFYTDDGVEKIFGLYAAKTHDKIFVSIGQLNETAKIYLNKENIKIIKIYNETSSQ